MPKRIMISCPNCHTQFPGEIDQTIDAGSEPALKARLLSGNLNVQRCPNCGAAFQVGAPLLYHDGSKDLLISYAPVELGMNKDQQEKAIGDLMRELTGRLPKEQIKGYFFQPRTALTMQGLVETILQGDGVTQEMMAEQRARVELIEQFLSTPPELRESVIEQNDAKIDIEFMQTLSLMGQRLAAEGHADIAEQLAMLQLILLEHSTFGRQLAQQAEAQEATVREVAADIQKLGAAAGREDFLELVQGYMGSEERLQALVGLARPAFDYQFFQALTMQIGQAPEAERAGLEDLRDTLLELTQKVDQQTQVAMEEAVQLLQVLIDAPDPAPLIAENLPFFDEAFLSVLQANLEAAQQRGNIEVSAKLRTIYEQVMSALRDNMSPELKAINGLMAAENEDAARELAAEAAQQYGRDLLPMIDAVQEMMAVRGEPQVAERLGMLRGMVEAALPPA
ncbi:MAG: CpXC domain-containing protein [Anaerolineae bacterium]|nr:CpXC domain-containing protein [Anaerolineae bacterium]